MIFMKRKRFFHTNFMKKALKISIAVCLILAVFLLSAAIAFLAITQDCQIEDNKLVTSSYNLEFYDKHNRQIQKVSSLSKRSNTPLAEIPSYTRQAFLSIEDKNFYKHSGIAPKRMLKALLSNLKNRSFLEGASTITQQLIKNTHLSNEKTITRKLKEIRLARMLERTHSKDEILEIYLNTVYFGHSAFGITDAAAFYFDKAPKTLSIGESALLAGLLQSPNRYSPFQNPEKCLSRRNLVLSEMKKDGALSETDYEAALSEPLPRQKHQPQSSAYLRLAYDELGEIAEQTGISNFQGLKIYTALDQELQTKLEAVHPTSDVAICVANHKAHTIEAYQSTAGNIKRLPGSLIKPLLIYAPSLEEGLISPETPILDEKTTFGDYAPSNYKDIYKGYISAREALATSANIPAVKLLNALTVAKGVHYLSQLDLDASEDQTLALALGGMKQGFTLTALTDAYSAFPEQGSYVKNKAILRVESQEGDVLYQTEYQKKQSFSEETATLINDMLQDTVSYGTAKKLKNLPYALCAKTGTVGTEQGNTDAYAIAYTSEHTVSVWLGNADYSTISASGGDSCEIARDILQFIYAKHTPPNFTKSDNVVRCMLDRIAYEKDHRLILADENSPAKERIPAWFNRKYVPTVRSTYFSSPRIQTPRISYENGKVTILLCDAEYYSYKVERCGIEGNTILYNNIQLNTIEDSDLLPNMTYIYRITPCYQGREGTPITLPAIRAEAEKKDTEQTPSQPEQSVPAPTPPPPIVNKEWWNQ